MGKKAATKKPTLYRIEVFTDANWQSRHRTVHRNGNILQSSEAYSSRAEALTTARGMCRSSGWDLVIS
jgi:uncharacterized protein YegP (UPF0339 family)